MYKKKRHLIFLIFAFFLTGCSLLLLSYRIKGDTPKEKNRIINKTDYNVTLKENMFYQEKTITSNKYYLAKLIEEINIDFNVALLDKEYDYTLTTSIVGYVDNEEIWTKEEKRETNKIIKNYHKKLTIDYDYYYNLAKCFKNTYNVPLEAKLVIHLDIKAKEKKDNYSLKLEIPLNDKVTYVLMKEEKQEQKEKVLYDYSFALGLACLIISVALTIKLHMTKKQDIKEILKEYHNLIIKIKNKPLIEKYNLIELNNLNNLIQIALNYETLIFNYQKYFYIFINKCCYIYQKNQD